MSFEDCIYFFQGETFCLHPIVRLVARQLVMTLSRHALVAFIGKAYNEEDDDDVPSSIDHVHLSITEISTCFSIIDAIADEPSNQYLLYQSA